jgi:DNA adenine methylase
LYIEPFLGAGSVYFHLQPKRAVLGDINEELINAYRAIRDDWQGLKRSLQYRQRAHREDPDAYFYRVRARAPQNVSERASRFVYLNRTCFNGIYRVNVRGKFNVPRGSKDDVVLDTDNFPAMARLLRRATLRAGDFERLVDQAVRGDFVFADPPYTVRHNHNGFNKYNEVLFSWKDQERLACALLRAAKRGVKVICANANHESIRQLYDSPWFVLGVTSRASRICADGTKRRHFDELIIRANV